MTSVKERHPEVFTERNQDPRQRVRKVPMEVLSLGLSRTGTMSMKAAFEVLGIPTWHWVIMAENPPDMAMWREALEAKFEPQSGASPFGRKEFDVFSATAILAEDLINAYPEAKVVLVERDTDRWYKSYESTVIQGTANPFIPFLNMIDKTYTGQMAAISDLVVRHYFHVAESRKYFIFNNSKFFSRWRENAKEVYRAHNEAIRRMTPSERLLVFRLDEGWGPLCAFLGKPVPSVPFPKVNETAAVQEKISAIIAEGYRRSMVKFAKRATPVIVALIAIFLWWRSRIVDPKSPIS